ncbi:divergent polysaccharide deacetylase family protein [Candidatus Cloacimonadota bacterium]
MTKRKKRKKNRSYNIHILVFIIIIIALFFIYIISKAPDNLMLRSDIIDRSFDDDNRVSHENVEAALLYSFQQLKVPDNYIRRRNLEEEIKFTIGISRPELDLNYANMVITAQVENSGGVILSGTESTSGNNHYLEIYDKETDQVFNVNLYYRNYEIDSSGKTLLAVIVDDFGYYNGDLLDDFMQLNSNLTFAILPGLDNTTEIMFNAEVNGHETMIHMPMEPFNYPKSNPGPDAIYVHMKENEIRRKMQFYFDQLPLCAGANNHMGSLVTADKDIMRIVLDELKNKGLYFVDSRTSQSSIAYSLAQEMMIPALENNLFLDTPDNSDETLKLKLKQLKSMQKSHDRLVVITHCNNRTQFNYLNKFLEAVDELNFELVPVSRLLKREIPDIL